MTKRYLHIYQTGEAVMPNKPYSFFAPFSMTPEERRELYRKIQLGNIEMFRGGIIDEDEYCRKTELVANAISWYFVAECWLAAWRKSK